MYILIVLPSWLPSSFYDTPNTFVINYRRLGESVAGDLIISRLVLSTPGFDSVISSVYAYRHHTKQTALDIKK
jgi:hypothetical protein